MLVIRRHPLAPHQRNQRGNPQHHRRPLPPSDRQHRRRTITGPDVVDAFTDAFTTWGTPAAVLTDNGAVFTATPRRGGRTALQILLGELGVNYINSRPYHPQTLRQNRTPPPNPQKRLAALHPAASITELQSQLNEFTDYYNTTRPTEPLHRHTPIEAVNARPKAFPTGYKIPRTSASATTKSTPPASSPSATTAACTTSAFKTSPRHQSPRPGQRPRHPGPRPTHRNTHPQTHTRPHPRLPKRGVKPGNSPTNRP